jgi:hypothetical protein
MTDAATLVPTLKAEKASDFIGNTIPPGWLVLHSKIAVAISRKGLTMPIMSITTLTPF